MNRMLAALGLLVVLIGSPAMAVEEPPFHLAIRSGGLEVRDYPALIAAEVTVGGDRGQAVNAGFRLLAAYIFGGNHGAQRIAMTAPVVQARQGGERIPMTAPVTQSGGSGAWVVQFIMPKGYTLATLPASNDPRVKLRQLPPTRIAVARFSGMTGDADIERNIALLEAFMAARHLRAAGRPSLSRYDPPWTPWFMRRNEIWIPLAS